MSSERKIRKHLCVQKVGEGGWMDSKPVFEILGQN
jgi:hypothetical protein